MEYDRLLQIRTLAESLIYELTKAFALPQTSRTQSLVRLVFGKAANAAAGVGVDLDHVVAEGGLSAGARWLLPRFVKSHEARGVEHIPSKGPLVIAANHPASVDSIVISAHINRTDYKVIIGDIPFFKHIPHISERAIFAPDRTDPMGRMQVIRDSISHLKDDGALLIFARGGIEADPAFMPDPGGEFRYWSRSLEIFLKRVPGLQILVSIVSGVIFPGTMKHPITWFRKARPDRQRLAFLYQFARQMISGREIFGLTPRVTFGEILSGTDRENVPGDIELAAHRTLSQHLNWGGV